MSSIGPQGPLLRQLPAALLHLSVPPGAESVLASLETLADPARGRLALAPGLWAFLPVAGDAAIFDAAVHWGQRLLGEAMQRLELAARAPQARALVLPGQVRWGEQAAALPEPLLTDLASRPPRFAAGTLLLTARAAQGLEVPLDLLPAATFEGSSGHVVPLLRLAAPRAEAPPWRCPEVLGRRPRFVPRPALSEELSRWLAAPAGRVIGGLGVGKTRFLYETLRAQGLAPLWLTAGLAQSGRGDLARQLAARLGLAGASPGRAPSTESLLAALAVAPAPGSATPCVVCDSLESATAADRELLAALAAAPALGPRYRLALVARNGTAWPAPLRPLPALHLPALAAAEAAALGEQLFAGLSLPAGLQAELLARAGGNPWLLEESVIQLASERRLRRVVGSFFFSGTAEEVPEAVTPRLVRHVEAELLRLGDPTPLRLLAAAGTVVPAAEVRAAGAIAELAIAQTWEAPYLAAGWLAHDLGPWGEGVTIAQPALRQALAQTLPAEGRRAMRRWLGELLAGLDLPGEARWESYRLLAGTAAGARLLLSSLTAARAPRAEAFAALRAEVQSLPEAEDDPTLEIDLLWALVPLGRRLAKLHEIGPEIDRALELTGGRGERFVLLATVKAELAANADDFDTAETLLRRALAAARGAADPRRQAQLCFELGRVLQRQGRLRDAGELLGNLLAVLEHQRKGQLAAQCRFLLGNLALRAGRFDEAAEHHRHALADRRTAGLSAAVASSLTALGSVALADGEPLQALAYFQEAEQLLVEHGRAGEVAYALIGTGRAQSRLGNTLAATAPLRRALAERQGRDDPHGEAIARLAVAENHLDLEQPEAALAEARRALFRLSLGPENEARADAERLIGRVLLQQRKPADAESHFAEALRLHRALARPQEAAHDLGWQLEAALARGDAEAVGQRCEALAAAAHELARPEAFEQLAFRMFRGLDWLARQGHAVADALPWLSRAYDELLRQTALLPGEHRHRFLFQIANHQSILELARGHGLVSGILGTPGAGDRIS